jgi:hypothetical protein
VQHPEHGNLRWIVVVKLQRPFQRRQRELVGPERPLERMAPKALDELGVPDDDSRLRPAEELVAGEADEVGAGGEAVARERLVAERDDRARAEVVDERQRSALRDPGELLEPRLLREADDSEVRLVDAE